MCAQGGVGLSPSLSFTPISIILLQVSSNFFLENKQPNKKVNKSTLKSSKQGQLNLSQLKKSQHKTKA